ncbi:MAG TPA: ImmA/IrrE family metallo-endopeptidase [Allosphingosinicella sp.]|nr:ImmA/IrrE family metallo-endopeptidase [Allosphingosinicella sp.]
MLNRVEEARRRAADLVAVHGFQRPPVDAERIARLEKANVLYASFNAEANDKVAAYADPSRVIYVNRELPPELKNYAIAHELAHFLLHPSYVESPDYKLLLRGAPVGNGESEEEKEAEAFAAELLVPRRMLENLKITGEPDSLASLFVAPVEVIRAQLALSVS